MGQLQNREVVVALTNAQRNGFARNPVAFLLIFGILKVFALPRLVGQQATHFTIQINARQLPKTQRRHEVVHGFHAHLIRQRVVIHIRRFDDAAVHIDRA